MGNTQKKAARNYGIELFRVVSMLMIVVLHINMNGGLMGCFSTVDSKYTALWFGETFCFACVDCFALISGYVMYNNKASAGKVLTLWAQVFSISALTGLFFLLFKDPNIPMDKIKDAFRPLTKNQYWYYTAYFGMYLLVPALNGAIASMSRQTHKKLCFIIFIFFTVMPIVFKKDFFTTSNGRNAFWLALLYIIGAYFGKYGVDRKKYPPLFCAVSALFCGLLLTVIVVYHSYKLGLETGRVSGQFDYLFNANPLLVLESILFLMCFSQLEFKDEVAVTVIKWLGASSFSVYLIHVQPIIFDFRFHSRFIPLSEHNALVMSLLVILWAVLVYLMCTVLDKIRVLVFKLLHINEGLKLLGSKIDMVFEKAIAKL